MLLESVSQLAGGGGGDGCFASGYLHAREPCVVSLSFLGLPGSCCAIGYGGFRGLFFGSRSAGLSCLLVLLILPRPGVGH